MNTLESPDATGKTAGNNRIKGCFGILVILLSMFLVLNLLAGSTRILPGEAFSALFRRQTEGTSARIILNIRLPRLLAAAILRTLCSGNLLRCKALCCTGDDYVPREGDRFEFGGDGRCGILRCDAFHGPGSAGKQKTQKHGPFGGLRRDDRICLFRDYGDCGDICRRQQHCKSPQLVHGKLLRNRYGGCGSVVGDCISCGLAGVSSLQTHVGLSAW